MNSENTDLLLHIINMAMTLAVGAMGFFNKLRADKAAKLAKEATVRADIAVTQAAQAARLASEKQTILASAAIAQTKAQTATITDAITEAVEIVKPSTP